MYKIGIIGMGRIGRVHCRSITQYVKDARIEAVADPLLNQELLNWAKDYGINKVYKDYRKILDDKTIDIVLICSSTETHAPISLEAIASSKHVFCEKPIDHDIERIKEVISALKASGIKYQVGFNRRFDHNFLAVKNAVKSGKIGKINIIKITSRDPAPPTIESMIASGGIFFDMAIHDFDMVRFISDSEVEEVYAVGGALTDKTIGEAGDIDTAAVTLKLKCGAFALIDLCRRASYGYDQRIEVFGSEGQVANANDTYSTAVISNSEGCTSEKPIGFFLERYMNAYAEEITQFIKAIKEDTPVPVTIEDGLAPALIGTAAKLSLLENRPVKLVSIAELYGLKAD